MSIRYERRGFLISGLLYSTVTADTFYYTFVRIPGIAQDNKLTTFIKYWFIGGMKYTPFQDVKIVEPWYLYCLPKLSANL